MSITIDSELKDVLGEINRKLDGVAKDVTDLKVSVARLDEKVDSIDKRLSKVESQYSTLVTDVSDLKGTKSLIIPIVVATLTSLLTLIIRAIPNP
jgi:archaellum component FlaC